jgi:hypothetical protein
MLAVDVHELERRTTEIFPLRQPLSFILLARPHGAQRHRAEDRCQRILHAASGDKCATGTIDLVCHFDPSRKGPKL